MAALVQEMGLGFEKWTRKLLMLATGHKAWKGGTCFADPTTATVSNVPGAGKLDLGVFAETIDNTTGAGPVPVNVNFIREKTLLWRDNDGSITAANLFSPCFAIDDHQVGIAGAEVAGTILAVDPTLGVLYELKGV